MGNNAAHKLKIHKVQVCFKIWMTWIKKKKPKNTFTISFFSICQERWYCDNALLSYAHSQETLVHTRNQPSNSHIGIISSHPIMAKNEKNTPNPQPNVRQPQERTILISKSHTQCTTYNSQPAAPKILLLDLPRAGWVVFSRVLRYFRILTEVWLTNIMAAVIKASFSTEL